MEKKQNNRVVQISYPCQWLYKVIGCHREKLQRALVEIAGEYRCQITPSHSSSTGKYHCLNLEVTVRSEDERNAIYKALKIHPQVKIVL